ncbi:hypothetical protein [Nocardiopsis sp. NPDC006938]|uniref:hypothetical protein n=1 Tax=Nocardiopsis sp. NPDC006938 TaxID=3364337 RepID=UPI003688C246
MTHPKPPRPAWLTPVSELLAAPMPPMEPPLTTEQGLALVRMLNTPGGASHVLSPSEHEFVCAQPAIRDHVLVQRLAEAVIVEEDGSAFVEGVRRAVAYAQGRERHGPLSGRSPRTVLPLCSDLDLEADLAEETLSGRADTPLAHPRDLLTGVEHTCLWLTCRTDEPPLRLPQ